MSKIDTYLQKVVRVIKVDNAHNNQLTPQPHMSDDLNTHVLSTFDAVIFDFDGTLADTSEQIISVARQVLSRFGLSRERFVDIPQLIGPPFPQAFELVFGYSPEQAQEITKQYRAIYSKLGRDAWPLFEGIDSMLHELKAAGKKLGVASSKRDHLLHRALEENDVEQVFDVILGKQDDSCEPKSQTLQNVINKLGIDASRCVMVGDRLYDVEAARACGIASIGVYYGKTAPCGELEQAGATFIVHSVEELKRALLS